MWFMRCLNAVTCALFYFFFVLPALLSFFEHLSVLWLWFAFVSIPVFFLIANFIFKQKNIMLSVWWGISWATVWTFASVFYVATLLHILQIYKPSDIAVWIGYAMIWAAVINFLSVFVLSFWKGFREYTPLVKIGIVRK